MATNSKFVAARSRCLRIRSLLGSCGKAETDSGALRNRIDRDRSSHACATRGRQKLGSHAIELSRDAIENHKMKTRCFDHIDLRVTNMEAARYANVPVARKPVIGLFATGTELLEVNEPLVPGKIRNSNSHMISAQIERVGGKVDYLGKLPDEFETCFNAVKNALDKVDLLVTTGGVSVGDFDYLPEIYEKLGANVLFNKVAMRPGSVTTVAEYNGKLLFGLSGNPSACYVGFELFARPVIRRMLFSQKPHLRKEKAILDTNFPKANPFTRFVRSALTIVNGKLRVSPSGLDKSNIIMSLAGSNSLMILPGGTRGYEMGTEVEVLMLEDKQGCEWPW